MTDFDNDDNDTVIPDDFREMNIYEKYIAFGVCTMNIYGRIIFILEGKNTLKQHHGHFVK
ncbi:hypothetical protein BLA29_009472 [Euroglyphus maynei]|uniref:Uncharacterized protein n=1 Tax=Euroglyphus maynei TaxID=6958 RepID=A0A1Y3BQV5_EURMA|nr:hypothetical protein BLA29_009472 [Euroglyphus maynei]